MGAFARRLFTVSVLAISLTGCGAEPLGKTSSRNFALGPSDHLEGEPKLAQALAKAPASESFDVGGEASALYATPPASPAAEATAAKTAAANRAADEAPARPERKIIYNAQVTLIVENINSTESQIDQLVKTAGGYLSEKEVTTNLPQRRTAVWKVRIPVGKFDSFLTAATRLGELMHNHIDSQDVTQEYYDLEARIANKQQEEKRLLKHLADSTGKLEDILAVERELSRVRGEIEQGQGRLRYLANLTALSTITITATEEKDYTPPVTATFGTQVGRTFHDSWHTLVDFGKGFVLVVVALVPWMPLIALVVGGGVWLCRRALRPRTPHPV